jgi:hypothetical protein
MNQESEEYQQLKQQYEHSRQLRDETNESHKTAILEALAAVGITSVEVGFDGYGDSGQIEDITAYVGSTVVGLGSTHMQIPEVDSFPPAFASGTLRDAIEKFCFDLLEMTHPGWEINEGSSGHFTFDVGKRLITLSGDTRYIEYESFEEEL